MKNRFLKRTLSMGVALCVAASFAGCGTQTNPTAPTAKNETMTQPTEGEAVEYNENGILPICKEKQKITIGIAQLSQVIDYDTNALTKKIEEDVNVDIEFVFFPEADAKQKFSIMANSGTELPGFFFH